MEFAALTPEAAREVWPKVEAYIAGALRRTGVDAYYWPLDVFFEIARGQMVLWVAHRGGEIDAAIVTKIETFPRLLACHVFLIGGKNLRAWAPLANEKLDQYARACGCTRMKAGGRFGWSRIAGYERRGDILVKEL